MGSRYKGADRSTGGYQARSVDAEERETERQTVLGAFAEAVGDQGLGDRETETEGDAADEETAENQETAKSPNWPGEDSSTATEPSETADETEHQGTSANWPEQRETLSDSEARGRVQESNAVISVVRNRIATPRSMSVSDHRAVVNLLEQAASRGAPLAHVAGKGFDDEIHGWLSVVSGHEDLSRKTKQRAKEVVDWFFF